MKKYIKKINNHDFVFGFDEEKEYRWGVRSADEIENADVEIMIKDKYSQYQKLKENILKNPDIHYKF